MLWRQPAAAGACLAGARRRSLRCRAPWRRCGARRSVALLSMLRARVGPVCAWSRSAGCRSSRSTCSHAMRRAACESTLVLVFLHLNAAKRHKREGGPSPCPSLCMYQGMYMYVCTCTSAQPLRSSHSASRRAQHYLGPSGVSKILIDFCLSSACNVRGVPEFCNARF